MLLEFPGIGKGSLCVAVKRERLVCYEIRNLAAMRDEGLQRININKDKEEFRKTLDLVTSTKRQQDLRIKGYVVQIVWPS